MLPYGSLNTAYNKSCSYIQDACVFLTTKAYLNGVVFNYTQNFYFISIMHTFLTE
jgi:hypothetical protein